jgi:hypothetical protein
MFVSTTFFHIGNQPPCKILILKNAQCGCRSANAPLYNLPACSIPSPVCGRGRRGSATPIPRGRCPTYQNVRKEKGQRLTRVMLCAPRSSNPYTIRRLQRVDGPRCRIQNNTNSPHVAPMGTKRVDIHLNELRIRCVADVNRDPP